eukprot:jgi/Botrbrau1/8404/Bobra.0237s0025.1
MRRGPGRLPHPDGRPPTSLDDLIAKQEALHTWLLQGLTLRTGRGPDAVDAPSPCAAQGEVREFVAPPCCFYGCPLRHFAGQRAVYQTYCCGGCQVVRYCSQPCQAKDWPQHRVACQFTAAKFRE